MPEAAEVIALPRIERRKPPAPGADFNEVEATIFARRSVRNYRDKQVPEHLVRRVLEAGRYAPSAGNGQPWRFVVVRDPRLLADMTQFIVGRVKKLVKWLDYSAPDSRALRGVTEFLMRKAPGQLHPIPLSAFRLIADGTLGVWHGAPTVIFILYDKRAPGSPELDSGIAGQNMVLAAHSLGLGTCWVSFAQIAMWKREFRQAIGLKHPYKLATTIALGYPRGNPDGFVQRETKAVGWIDEQGTREVY
jgi:nitroreductase